jgi:hypothetical protein
MFKWIELLVRSMKHGQIASLHCINMQGNFSNYEMLQRIYHQLADWHDEIYLCLSIYKPNFMHSAYVCNMHECYYLHFLFTVLVSPALNGKTTWDDY